ncbi:TetR/AcrR family transcriptional regulator [Winslowiella toletana]|uniref:TetR/AcrR family transcriptional regulator n=1 Tax=Winslowiella toletana TaxID=92490 RepID=UPI0028BE6D7D|nr:TetR/AcrR family transcriptional regulator [Winslowiella toletana]WNN43430.1 TetR/AcrR family transcriptional regulator [Winslowiella toletana]
MDVATDLFNREGYQSVGVDKIAAEAGVSKLTLYRHFPSKERLINEVLRKRKDDFLQDISAVIRHQPTTKEQLFSFFCYYHDWFKHEDFHGCMFTHSLSEFGRKSTTVLEINQEIKRHLMQILLTILSPLVKGERAHRIAYVFIILIDGSITAELTWRDQNEYSPALAAWSTAKTILESEGIHF